MPGGIFGQLNGSSLFLDTRLAGVAWLWLGLERLYYFIRISRSIWKRNKKTVFMANMFLLCSFVSKFWLLFGSASLSPSKSFYWALASNSLICGSLIFFHHFNPLRNLVYADCCIMGGFAFQSSTGLWKSARVGELISSRLQTFPVGLWENLLHSTAF